MCATLSPPRRQVSACTSPRKKGRAQKALGLRGRTHGAWGPGPPGARTQGRSSLRCSMPTPADNRPALGPRPKGLELKGSGAGLQRLKGPGLRAGRPGASAWGPRAWPAASHSSPRIPQARPRGRWRHTWTTPRGTCTASRYVPAARECGEQRDLFGPVCALFHARKRGKTSVTVYLSGTVRTPPFDTRTASHGNMQHHAGKERGRSGCLCSCP